VAGAKGIIDIIVVDHLVPVLAAHGFVRKGRSRTFHTFADNGDAVVVNVQTSSGSRKELAKFYINLALVPLPWLQWMRESDDPADLRDPHDSEGAVTGRVRSIASGDWSQDAWVCTLDQVHKRGETAAEALGAVLPDFLALLDRGELLSRLETGAALPGFCPDVAMRAILYLDAGRWDDVRREVDDIAAYQPESTFVTWVRQQIEARDSRPRRA
jgi:Domain of unknown function (DUF4304)